MRYVLSVVLLLACGAVASADIPLADMGLSDLRPYSGDDVRGMGYVSASGYSYASITACKHCGGGTAWAKNSFKATSKTRNAEAGGEHLSFASYKNLTIQAGGYAAGYAK